MLIRDVKSSNGTFVNGERLSLEGAESDAYELRSDDILVRVSTSSPRSRLLVCFVGLRRFIEENTRSYATTAT